MESFNWFWCGIVRRICSAVHSQWQSAKSSGNDSTAGSSQAAESRQSLLHFWACLDRSFGLRWCKMISISWVGGVGRKAWLPFWHMQGNRLCRSIHRPCLGSSWNFVSLAESVQRNKTLQSLQGLRQQLFVRCPASCSHSGWQKRLLTVED